MLSLEATCDRLRLASVYLPLLAKERVHLVAALCHSLVLRFPILDSLLSAILSFDSGVRLRLPSEVEPQVEHPDPWFLSKYPLSQVRPLRPVIKIASPRS